MPLKLSAWRVNFHFCRYVGVAFFITTALSGCFSFSKRQEEAVLYLRNGTSLLEQGQYPSALRELLKAEELDSSNPQIQNNLGLAYFLRGRADLALKHVKRAVDLDESYSEARNNYARVLIELGRYDEAIVQTKKVLSDLTFGDPSKAYINLGLAYFRKGEMPAARRELSAALKINRGNCVAQNLYGRTLIELGEFTVAAEALDNAVEICRSQRFDEPFYFSGLAYYRLGRRSSATARMEEVIRLYPESPYVKKAEELLKLMK